QPSSAGTGAGYGAYVKRSGAFIGDDERLRLRGRSLDERKREGAGFGGGSAGGGRVHGQPDGDRTHALRRIGGGDRDRAVVDTGLKPGGVGGNLQNGARLAG